jgi:hypothetical protein
MYHHIILIASVLTLIPLPFFIASMANQLLSIIKESNVEKLYPLSIPHLISSTIC